MSRRRPTRAAKGPSRHVAELEAEVTRLRRELEDARAALRRAGQADAAEAMAAEPTAEEAVTRRIAALEEGRMVARGQAVEAALARSQAEGKLKALRASIERASGLRGWLLRKLLKVRDAKES